MSTAPYTPDEMMTVTAARQLVNGAVCFVGIGLPSAACNLARLTHAGFRAEAFVASGELLDDTRISLARYANKAGMRGAAILAVPDAAALFALLLAILAH